MVTPVRNVSVPKNRLRVENASLKLDVGNKKSRIGVVFNLETKFAIRPLTDNCQATVVIDIAQTEIQIELTPVELFRFISETDFEAVDSLISKVRICVRNIGYQTGRGATGYGIAGRRVASQVHNLLRGQDSNQVVLVNLEPVGVGGESVCSAPPAVIGIRRARTPGHTGKISVARFWFYQRISACVVNYIVLAG